MMVTAPPLQHNLLLGYTVCLYGLKAYTQCNPVVGRCAGNGADTVLTPGMDKTRLFYSFTAVAGTLCMPRAFLIFLRLHLQA